MNVFLGSFDRVLEPMFEHVPLQQVVPQQGKLRNARLQWRIEQSGALWHQVASRTEFDSWAEQQDQIDLCVVAGFSFILNQQFLDKCRCVINFHPGILQQCRGPQPVAAAILAGHKEFGLSVHRIDSEAIDAGPIISQRRQLIDYEKTYAANYNTMKVLMAEMADELFRQHGVHAWPQGETWEVDSAAYFSRVESHKLAELARAPRLTRWQV